METKYMKLMCKYATISVPQDGMNDAEGRLILKFMTIMEVIS